MDYLACLDVLESLGHEIRGVKFDLETTERLLAVLGNPHLKYPAVIVAGTNGKGSTSAMIAAALEHAGFSAGLYTSPHLVRVNERIRSNEREISDEDFAAAFTAVHKAAGELARGGELARAPSYFEYLTAVAFSHFASAATQFAVLEVGMGGRLDATNVVDPLVSIVTNVTLDHEPFLGPTVEAIASEKAGVIKPGRPAVSGCEHEGARAVIRRRCEEAGSELVDLAREACVSNVTDCQGRFSFDFALGGDRLRNLAPSLAGRFQVRNAAAAAAAALLLRKQGVEIPDDAIRAGLADVRWPGRIETIRECPLVLLDGAHNPAAARALAVYLREELAGRRIRLVYASMRDKAIEEISAVLFPLACEVYLTALPMARAASPREILDRSRIDAQRAIIQPEPLRAAGEACGASRAEDAVVIAGSLFLVGAIERARREGTLILDPRPPCVSDVRPMEHGGPSLRG
ncbi:MAG: bifunctional folylpolyglutamate synthase/dihydrofolate synthase [Terriglobia bacterium]